MFYLSETAWLIFTKIAAVEFIIWGIEEQLKVSKIHGPCPFGVENSIVQLPPSPSQSTPGHLA